MKDIKIVCDYCNKELTNTRNSIDYCLSLSSQRIPCQEGAVTDIMVLPPIEREANFCGLGCLKNWIDKKAN